MAFASPRRTARETSDSAGRFHSVFPRTVLPNMSKYHRANDVRPYGIPFQEPRVDVGIDPYSNNAVIIARQVPARATMAFASPRRTARAASDSAGRFHGVFPRAVLPGTSKYHRANHVRPYSIPFQVPRVDVGIDPYSNNAVTNARQRQPWAFASPRRTARETSDSAGRFHGVFPRAVLPNTSKYHRANHEKTHLTAVRCVFSGIEYIKSIEDVKHYFSHIRISAPA